MARSRTPQRAKRHGAAAPHAGAPKVTPALRRVRLRRILWETFTRLALAIAVIGLFHVLQAVPQIRATVEYSYDWLQTRLTPVAKAAANIVVVDVSDIPTVSRAEDPGTQYTPRDRLLGVITTIDRQGPAAIGIDIDFALDESGEYFTPGDPVFLKNLIKLQTRTFVGVSRGLGAGPAEVLRDPAFTPLVTYVIRQNPDGFGPNPRMSEYAEIPYLNADGTPAADPWMVRSLAVALAGEPAAGSWPAWLVVRRTRQPIDAETPGLAVHPYLVDFSPIDDFERAAIPSAALPAMGPSLKDRIVLVGRASKGNWPTNLSDTFTVPGHRESAYPGVLLHACATYTLLNATLWQFTPAGSLVVDLGFSALVFIALAAVALFYNSIVVQDVAVHRLNKLFTWAAVFGVFAIGLWFVNRTRLMWPDYVLVAGSLLLHSSLEQPDNPLRTVGRWLRQGWRAVALHRTEGGHSS
jgi:CHASE2 domain-containing sensor protein